jgi:hypothetical protein
VRGGEVAEETACWLEKRTEAGGHKLKRKRLPSVSRSADALRVRELDNERPALSKHLARRMGRKKNEKEGKGNMVKLFIVVVAVLTPLLAKGDTTYNLDQLPPLEKRLQPLVYDVFSVCYFGVEPVYTQIPAEAIRYWQKARSYPTHPLDFVITYIKVTRSHQDSLDIHCVGLLTLIDETGDGKITGTIYAEWDLSFTGNGPWSIQPALDPGAKPVLTAFNESSSSDFVKEYPGLK